MWIFNPEQLVRVILSRPPSEVHKEHSEIIGELQNATQKRIIIDEIRYHVDSMGRIRMDWCDMFFHAVEPSSQMIVPVDDILKVIDSHYDFLKVGSNQRTSWEIISLKLPIILGLLQRFCYRKYCSCSFEICGRGIWLSTSWTSSLADCLICGNDKFSGAVLLFEALVDVDTYRD